MADMCGPSNALSNFQKHITVDRTLQQDRLTSRQSPGQGFRSAPGPNARHLDPEFEAFQAGHVPFQPGAHQDTFSHPQQHMQAQGYAHAGPANWAADFQRMNISSPTTQQFQQHGFGGQIQQRGDIGGWHQDFAQQQNQMGSSSMARAEQQSNYMQQYPTMSGGLGMGVGMGMGVGQQYGGYGGLQQEQMQSRDQVEHFDDEAFARAFDEAAKAETEQREQDQQGVEVQEGVMIDESAEKLMSSETDLSKPLDQPKIGADTIHDPANPNDQQTQEGPDALARTAGRLLDSVAHDQSEKMKGSMFMELMRQFRDGDLGVKGEEVVDREGKPADGGSMKVV